jgi:polysaccharide pyruvyl transferase CsaB
LRYLISGYYGERNAGDEAILAGILQEVERRDPRSEFTVLSFAPEDTKERHGAGRRLETLPTSLRSPGRLLEAMRSTDLLLSGGGSLLHEADFELHGRSFLLREGKLRPVPYFLSVVLLARSQGLPVMWYAQGLGPLHTWASRRLVARAASASQAVTWRDSASARLAYDIGVRAPVQEVVPDPAYALVPAPDPQVEVELSSQGVAGRRFLAVCPRPWLGREKYLDHLGQALEQVARESGLDVVLIPFHESQDPPVCKSLAARTRLAGRAHVCHPIRSPGLLAAVLGRAELVVAMRLHSGILASTVACPAVVIDYDPKTNAFAAQTRQTPWAVSVDRLEHEGPGALAGALMSTLTDLPARRAALARAVSPLRAEAGRTAGLAVQLAADHGSLAMPVATAAVTAGAAQEADT